MPLIAAVLATWSWRWCFVAIGIGALALIPLLWSMLAPQVRPSPGETAPEPGLSTDLLSVLREPAFLLVWSFLLCDYTTAGVIETHFMPYASFCGFGPIPSATAYGVLSVNMAGMILAGWLTDRMNRVVLLASIYLARGLTFVVLMNVGADFDTLIVFAVLFGAVDYATVPVTASLVASHLDLRVMGLSMGMISAGHSIGAAAGAFLGGYLFDLTLRCDWVWLSSVALAAVAGLFVLALQGAEGDDTASSRCREVFEKIAKEGRKFGIGLVLSSQRPSELSPTIVAQCNSFLLHRIVNDRDQELVRKLVSDSAGALVKESPSLPAQQAILLGIATEIPVVMNVKPLTLPQQPQSRNPDFWNVWSGADERRLRRHR